MLDIPLPSNSPNKSVENVNTQPRPHIKENKTHIADKLSNAKNLDNKTKTEKSNYGDKKDLTRGESSKTNNSESITKNNKSDNDIGKALTLGESSKTKSSEHVTKNNISSKEDGESLKQGESFETNKSEYITKTNTLLTPTTNEFSKKRRRKGKKSVKLGKSSKSDKSEYIAKIKKIITSTTNDSSNKRRQNRIKALKNYLKQNANPTFFTPPYPFEKYPQGFQNEFNPYSSLAYSRLPSYETSRDLSPPFYYEDSRDVYYRPSYQYGDQYQYPWKYPRGLNNKFQPYYFQQYYKRHIYANSRPIYYRPSSRYVNQDPWNY